MSYTHEDPDESRWGRTRIAAIALAIAVLVAGAFALLRWMNDSRTRPAPVAEVPPPAPPVAAAPPAPAPPAEQPVQHPLETIPVPAPLGLDDSDATVLDEVAKLAHAHGLLQWLYPTAVVRHVVATVDALPRRQVPLQVMPTKPVPGRFVVTRAGDDTLIGADNAARYAPYVGLLTAIDPAAAAATYRRFYPLFQQAYRELGYPKGYFNDRLVDAIDDALAAPDLPPPLRVVAPRAMWEYADPQLESLSAGQKILLRMGQPNAQAVRTWLKAFRGRIG